MNPLSSRCAVAACVTACAALFFVRGARAQTSLPAGGESLGQQVLRRPDRHAMEYQWSVMRRPNLGTLSSGDALNFARRRTARMRSLQIDTTYWRSIGPWPATVGSYGEVSGRVTTLAIDPVNPQILYVGAAEGGVWKTTDGGTNWSPMTDNQPTLASGALAVDPVDPSIIYWGTGEPNGCGSLCYLGIGILKSTDGGVNWSTTGMQNTSSATHRIVIDPSSTNLVYAAMNNGIYRSTNGGSTFSSALAGSTTDLAIDTSAPQILFAAVAGTGVYKSTNGGASWTQKPTGLPPGSQISRMSLDLCAGAPAFMYAGIYGPNPGGSNPPNINRVFKSTDAGETWNALGGAPDYGGGQGWYNNYVRVDPSDSNTVYLGGIDIWRTTDGGASWTNLTNGYSGGPVHVDQHALVFFPSDPHHVIFGNDGGVYATTDRGASWSDLNHNLITIQFYSIAVDLHSSTITFGGTQDNGTQRRMGGFAWQDVTGGDGMAVNVDYSNGKNVYAEYPGGFHLKSLDGGFTFSAINSGIAEQGNWLTPVLIDPVNPQVLYTGTTKLYRSANGGNSWGATSTPIDALSPMNNVSAIAVAPTSTSTIYVGLGNHGVYRSVTAGSKWVNATGTLPALWVSDILVHPDSSTVAYVALSGYGASHVWKTTNIGSTWTDISSNLPDVPVNSIVMDPSNNNTLVIGTDAGVFRTTDQGGAWSPFMNGLPNVAVSQLEFTATGILRAATAGRGMWEYSNPSMVVLTVSVTPAGGGTVTPGTLTVRLDSVVTLTATPAAGFSFGTWGGDTSTNSNPIQVAMWKNKDLVANFRSLSLPRDAFYTSVNSDRHEIPFAWVELSGDPAATKIPPTAWHNSFGGVGDPIDDGTAGPYPLGMPFYFYGNTALKTQIYIGANGALSLSQDNVNAQGYYTDTWTIPGVPIRDFVSPFWNDLYLTPGSGHGNVFVKGDSLNRKFIVEWFRAGNFNSTADTTTTFEVELDGSTNTLVFQYLHVGTTGLDSTALIGIQADSATGLLYYLGEKVKSPLELKTHDSLAIGFNPRFVVAVRESPAAPATFALEQNYPNPFNPSTQIRFSIPRPGHVSLVVYNILGEKVLTLVQGALPQGLHLATFDGSALPSGMYFYQLRTDESSAVRKMLLVK